MRPLARWEKAAQLVPHGNARGMPVTPPMAQFRAKSRPQNRAAWPYDAAGVQSARDFRPTITRARPIGNGGNRSWTVIGNATGSRWTASAESIIPASGHKTGA